MISNAILLNTRLPGVSMQFDLIDEETLLDHASALLSIAQS